MKKSAILLAVSMFSFFFVACSNGDDNTNESNNNGTEEVVSNSWSITFDANGGNVKTTSQTASKSDYTTLTTAEALGLSYEDHVFHAWGTTADGSDGIFYADGSEIKPTGNITLYALWLNTNEDAVSANADGSYTVTPYNITSTLKAISESGATTATLYIEEMVDSTTLVQTALQTYSTVSVSLDLSKSTWLTGLGSTWTWLGGYYGPSFSGCTNLKSIVISDSVETIGYYTFSKCTNMQEITLPKNLKSLVGDCFGGSTSTNCNSLTTVKYNGTLEDWLNIGFYSSLYCNPNFAAWNNVYENYTTTHSFLVNGKELTKADIPNTITSIPNYAFCGTNIESVTIPSSVESIGTSAFQGCWNLSSVTLPKSVTSVKDTAFKSCRNLTSVTISSALEIIPQQMFSYCTSLASISIPKSVKEIDLYAFFNCTALTSVTFEDTESIWYCDDTEIGTMNNPSTNATRLKETYVGKTLKQK